MNKRYIYAVYIGDMLLDVGTAEELSQRLGVKEQSFVCYFTPKRMAKRTRNQRPYEHRRIIIRFPEEDVDDG